MKSFSQCMGAYHQQMAKGEVQIAYSGLMRFMVDLRNHLQRTYPDFYVSGNFYQGNMDFTYFSLTPRSLKNHRLRLAVVFIHKTLTFKIWLGGLNRKVQASYWERLVKKGWKKYVIPKSIENIDYIIESTLADDSDFNDLKKLTARLEKGILKFSTDMELYISKL